MNEFVVSDPSDLPNRELALEAAGMGDPDDIPILSMLVHGTSPAGIGEAIGVHERELAGRRKRMLRALLGD